MKTSMIPLLTALVLSLPSSITAWQDNETSNSYVAWPADVQTRLENEWTVYHGESFPLPVLRAFDTFPIVNPKKPDVWDLLKSINTRLHPILWPRAHYWVEEGIDFGCRIPQDDGSTLPNTTAHCHRHCTHQGRYCLPHPDNSDLRFGRDSVKEIIRRLCMDEIYHAKDPRFIAYLQEFEAQGCFQLEMGERECAIQAIHKVGMHWSELEECLAEADYEEDVSNTVLNRNLRHLNKPQMKTVPLPAVAINGKPIKQVDTPTIFQDFCDAFPTYLQQPLACHVCKDCGNVRECLWNLNCDGVEFESENVHQDVMGADLAPDDTVEVARTEAPSDYQDNQHDGDTDIVMDGVDMNEVDTMPLPDTQVTVGLVDKAPDADAQAPTKKNRNPGFLFLGILLIVTAVAGAAVFVYHQGSEYHARRAKELLSEIANGKYNRNSQELYKDQELGGRAPEGDENPTPPTTQPQDYRGRAQQLLEEINNGSFKRDSFRDLRQRDMEKATEPAVVEDVYGDDGGASDGEDDDDIKVEDMLEEESEWVEQKRFSGQALPAIL